MDKCIKTDLKAIGLPLLRWNPTWAATWRAVCNGSSARWLVGSVLNGW